MMILRNSLVFFVFLSIFSCVRESPSPRVSADSLFQTFQIFSRQTQKDMSDDYFLSCSDRSQTSIGAFFRVVDDYVEEMSWVNREGRSLKRVQIAMLTFANAIDSVSSEVYGDEFGKNIVTNSISKNFKNLTSFTARDTVFLLNEALRVLALGSASCPQYKPACRADAYWPYIEIQPIAKEDSIRVRVGLRIQNVCVDPYSFAVVLGDTVAFNYSGLADFKYHANRLQGVDSLRINSCVGRQNTGEISCFTRGVEVGW